MKICKFGWTSMGTAPLIKTVASICIAAAEKEQIGIVVSAMSTVTDTLVSICEEIMEGNESGMKTKLAWLETRHFQTLQELLVNNVQSVRDTVFVPKFDELRIMCTGCCLLRDVSPKNKAAILYFGEIWSALLLEACFHAQGQHTACLLSKDIIITNDFFLDGTVDFPATKKNCENQVKTRSSSASFFPIITGFAGGTDDGNVCLLGRWGSDYVATIIGRGIDATSVEIWTDVDGIHSADPRFIQRTTVRNELDYRVCVELALAGAKVLHPKTLAPVMQKHIPVQIKNTFAPEKEGTKIRRSPSSGIKGINCNTKQILLHFTDTEMFGAIGYIHKITEFLAKENIVIDSFATSEVSFTCSIREDAWNQRLEEKIDTIAPVQIIRDVAKISIVGNDINEQHILEKVFAILAKRTIHLISQGASHTNLTLFIDNDGQTQEIVQKLHDALLS